MNDLFKVICIASALLVIAPLGASAQKAYAYDHSLDFTSGASLGMVPVYANDAVSTAAAVGGNSIFRYTWFYSLHFGVYGQYMSSEVNSNAAVFFGTMNKLDAGKYMYRYDYREASMGITNSFTLGLAYRYDFGSFSLRPRLGLGYGEIDPVNYSWERRLRDGSDGPYYMEVYTSRYDASADDYLMDGYSSGYSYATIPVPVVSGSLQLMTTLGSRFTLFCETGLDWNPLPVEYSYTSKKSITNYNPSNWVESVAFTGNKNVWVVDESSAKTVTKSVHTAPIFHFNVGIGIHLGKNYNK